MKTNFLLIPSAIILALGIGSANAAPVQLTTAQMDTVTAGGSYKDFKCDYHKENDRDYKKYHKHDGYVKDKDDHDKYYDDHDKDYKKYSKKYDYDDKDYKKVYKKTAYKYDKHDYKKGNYKIVATYKKY
jgi:hypothetical protein